MIGFMFTFSRPEKERIDTIIASQEGAAWSYPHVGRTCEAPKIVRQELHGWDVDTASIKLGEGQSCWQCAKKALKQWRMFDVEFASICWPTTAI